MNEQTIAKLKTISSNMYDFIMERAPNTPPAAMLDIGASLLAYGHDIGSFQFQVELLAALYGPEVGAAFEELVLTDIGRL